MYPVFKILRYLPIHQISNSFLQITLLSLQSLKKKKKQRAIVCGYVVHTHTYNIYIHEFKFFDYIIIIVILDHETFSKSTSTHLLSAST